MAPKEGVPEIPESGLTIPFWTLSFLNTSAYSRQFALAAYNAIAKVWQLWKDDMPNDRITEPNPPLYEKYMRLLNGPGVMGMNSEEALAYWVTVLQRLAAEVECGTNADPVAEAPRLFVFGKNGKDEYSEVDFLKDDPSNILDETWSPIEMRDWD